MNTFVLTLGLASTHAVWIETDEIDPEVLAITSSEDAFDRAARSLTSSYTSDDVMSWIDSQPLDRHQLMFGEVVTSDPSHHPASWTGDGRDLPVGSVNRWSEMLAVISSLKKRGPLSSLEILQEVQTRVPFTSWTIDTVEKTVSSLFGLITIPSGLHQILYENRFLEIEALILFTTGIAPEIPDLDRIVRHWMRECISPLDIQSEVPPCVEAQTEVNGQVAQSWTLTGTQVYSYLVRNELEEIFSLAMQEAHNSPSQRVPLVASTDVPAIVSWTGRPSPNVPDRFFSEMHALLWILRTRGPLPAWQITDLINEVLNDSDWAVTHVGLALEKVFEHIVLPTRLHTILGRFHAYLGAPNGPVLDALIGRAIQTLLPLRVDRSSIEETARMWVQTCIAKLRTDSPNEPVPCYKVNRKPAFWRLSEDQIHSTLKALEDREIGRHTYVPQIIPSSLSQDEMKKTIQALIKCNNMHFTGFMEQVRKNGVKATEKDIYDFKSEILKFTSQSEKFHMVMENAFMGKSAQDRHARGFVKSVINSEDVDQRIDFWYNYCILPLAQMRQGQPRPCFEDKTTKQFRLSKTGLLAYLNDRVKTF